MRAVLRAVIAAGVLASPAFAQSSSSGTWNGLSDRFQIDTGYFRISADTVLRYNGPQGSGDIDFEKDLGVNQDANTFWLDATWRVGRRHQLKLGYTRLVRDRGDYTLQRDLTWGGETYDAGLTASSSTGSDILGGYYRFACFGTSASRSARRSASATSRSTPASRRRGRSAVPAARPAARSTRRPPRAASPAPWEATPMRGRRSVSRFAATFSTSR